MKQATNVYAEFSPEEMVMIHIAPIALLVDQIMQATEKQQKHDSAVYQEIKNKVLSIDAKTSVQLVGAKVPIGTLIDLCRSYSAMRETEFGKALTEKYVKAMEEARDRAKNKK